MRTVVSETYHAVEENELYLRKFDAQNQTTI
jgi:hypothetical protein